MTSNPNIKDTPLFDVEYLRTSYDGILIGTYTHALLNGVNSPDLEQGFQGHGASLGFFATAELLVKLTVNCHFTLASGSLNFSTNIIIIYWLDIIMEFHVLTTLLVK